MSDYSYWQYDLQENTYSKIITFTIPFLTSYNWFVPSNEATFFGNILTAGFAISHLVFFHHSPIFGSSSHSRAIVIRPDDGTISRLQSIDDFVSCPIIYPAKVLHLGTEKDRTLDADRYELESLKTEHQVNDAPWVEKLLMQLEGLVQNRCHR